MNKRDLWGKVFGEVITMTKAELLAALIELGATSPEAAYQAYQEDEIGAAWFEAQAETKKLVFNK